MTRRLVIAMVALAAVVAVALAIPLALIVDNGARIEFVSGLERDTLITASKLSSQEPLQWQSTVDATAEATGARVVVVDSNGTLVADSDRSDVDRSFDRTELTEALSGNLASDVRYSQTLQQDLRYVAAPVVQGGTITAAVRLSLPEAEVTAIVNRTRLTLLLFVVSVMAAAALLAWILATSISAPLRNLARVAEDLPDDLSLRAAPAGPREVRGIATALNRTAERLGALISRQQRVAADASHHLKTPLTGIRLRLEAIEDTAAEDRVRREAAAATAEVDRLHRRIDQVLALARADAGATITVCDVAAVVSARCAEMASIAAGRGLVIDLTIDEGPHEARAATGAVESIIDELISNALDYASTRIVVSVHGSNEAVSPTDAVGPGEVVVQVEDDGPGIPEGEHELVFARFTRGTAAVPGGSGMGLALVRELARASGGDAAVAAADSAGCRIVVTLPRP